MKKCLAVGVICLLMLMAIPIVIGDDEIEFPKEDGPYTIFVGGFHRGSAPLKPIEIEEGYIQLGPLCFMKYPKYLSINYFQVPEWDEFIIVFINGQYQGQLVKDFHGIEVYGFKGIFSSYFLTGFNLLLFHRLRAYGICDEIDFS